MTISRSSRGVSLNKIIRCGPPSLDLHSLRRPPLPRQASERGRCESVGFGWATPEHCCHQKLNLWRRVPCPSNDHPVGRELRASARQFFCFLPSILLLLFFLLLIRFMHSLCILFTILVGPCLPLFAHSLCILFAILLCILFTIFLIRFASSFGTLC